MFRLGILTVMLLLGGCEDTYRYPCQDPANWNNEHCKRPKCEVDGQCSDELTGGASSKVTDGSTHTTAKTVKEVNEEPLDVEVEAEAETEQSTEPHNE